MIALPAEAKAIINHYGLSEPLTLGHMRLYEKAGLRVLISGASERLMTKAFGFLEARGIEKHHGFLNIGIAGGDRKMLGHAFHISTIKQAKHKTFYPTITNTKESLATLTSLSDDHTGHNDASLTDQEGHAFFDMATRFVPQEQVALIKVVSDYNPEGMRKITASSCTELIKAHISTIEETISHLKVRSMQEALVHRTIDITPFCKRWHLTHSQKKQLQTLLQQALVHECALDLEHCASADELLRTITQRLNQHNYNF